MGMIASKVKNLLPKKVVTEITKDKIEVRVLQGDQVVIAATFLRSQDVRYWDRVAELLTDRQIKKAWKQLKKSSAGKGTRERGELMARFRLMAPERDLLLGF